MTRTLFIISCIPDNDTVLFFSEIQDFSSSESDGIYLYSLCFSNIMSTESSASVSFSFSTSQNVLLFLFDGLFFFTEISTIFMKT